MNKVISTHIEVKNPETNTWETDSRIRMEHTNNHVIAILTGECNEFCIIPIVRAKGIPEDSPEYGEEDPKLFAVSCITLSLINKFPDCWELLYPLTDENGHVVPNITHRKICEEFFATTVSKMTKLAASGKSEEDVRVLVKVYDKR